MAFDATGFRRAARGQGFSSKEIDDVIKRVQTRDLARKGVVSLEDLAKEDPGGALKLSEEGVVTKPTTEEAKQETKRKGVSESLDVLEKNLKQIGTRGPIAGQVRFLSMLTGGKIAPDIADFVALRKALIGPLARVISGEVGVLTDRDIGRAEGLLPAVTDTKELATKKVNNLRELLKEPGRITEERRDAGGLVGGVAKFLFPETTEFAQQVSRGELGEAAPPPLSQLLLGPAGARGQAGAAAKELATDIGGGLLLGGLLGKGRKAAKPAGRALRRGVVQPKVAATPFAAKEEKAILKGLEKLGIKGSARAQMEALPGAMKKLTTKIDDALSKITKTKNFKGVKTQLIKASDDSVNFVPGDTAYIKVRDRALTKLKSTSGIRVTASDLFKFKQSLGKRLSRAFDKLAKGNPLTVTESAEMAVWESMDELITSLAPKVKTLTQQQSILFRAAPGLQRSARTAGVKIPLTTIRAGGGAIQTGQDILGRLLSGGP